MNLADVTVCVPCFEQAEYLPVAVASVFEQTLPVAEIIVVDDGTPDGSVRDATRALMGGTGPTVRYVRVTNRGLPNARNTALMLATGGAFLPLDADDWLDPTYVEKTLPLLADADVVLTGIREHGVRNGEYLPGYDRPPDQVTLDVLWQGNRFYYCSLFRTQTLREVGGYNGRMVNGWEDWDLWLELRARGVRFAWTYELLFNYLTKAESMAVNTDRNWKDWNRAEMRRHHESLRDL